MTSRKDHSEYWRKNLRTILACLAIWASVSLGFGVVFAPALNAFQIAGYPLGFWFAHQGSIYTFVVLIFFYTWRMNKLDREHDVDER